MEKIIKINIYNEYDLNDIYNEDLLNTNLIAYLIKEMNYVNRKDKIKIVVNNKAKTKINIKNKIKEGLKREYLMVITEHQKNNLIQFVLFIIGVFLLFLSTIYKQLIWHEVLVIIGWVPIWEMVDIEIFSGINERRLKRILKKLMKSKIVIK